MSELYMVADKLIGLLSLCRTNFSARTPPVKVEGFQELMGGDSTLKHDSEEHKLTSPSK